MLGVESKACIITFLGPVGVGKSTQIKLLRDHLRSRNVRVVDTFIKSTHGFAYILSRSLIALGVSERISYPENTTRIYPRGEVVKGLFGLWTFLDTLSISAKFFLTVYMPFCLGFTVLIEEGLFMTLYTYRVSLPRFFKTEPKVPPLVPKLIGWIMSKKNVNVVLDAVDDELARRRKQRNFRQNELSEYISLQRKWIKRLDFDKTVLIDTTDQPVMRVHKNIIIALEKCMPEKI